MANNKTLIINTSSSLGCVDVKYKTLAGGNFKCLTVVESVGERCRFNAMVIYEQIASVSIIAAFMILCQMTARSSDPAVTKHRGVKI